MRHDQLEQIKAGATAATVGAAVFGWYAMPDYLPSRRARRWIKLPLVTVTTIATLAAGVLLARTAADTDPEPQPDTDTDPAHRPNWVRSAALIAAFISFGLVIQGAVECVMLHIGRARAARGKRFAHSLPALVLAAAVAGLEYGVERYAGGEHGCAGGCDGCGSSGMGPSGPVGGCCGGSADGCACSA